MHFLFYFILYAETKTQTYMAIKNKLSHLKQFRLFDEADITMMLAAFGLYPHGWRNLFGRSTKVRTMYIGILYGPFPKSKAIYGNIFVGPPHMVVLYAHSPISPQSDAPDLL